MPVHARPANTDFADARDFEQAVADALEPDTHGVLTRFDSSNDLDIWVPGYYLDVKEKRQRYGKRFTNLWPHLEERDMFILDELSIRRALEKDARACYFLVRDVPGGDRLFLLSALEVAMSERCRVDRETSAGNRKGKWLVDLGAFRRLPTIELVHEFVMSDMTDCPWKQSSCLAHVYDIPTT